MWVFADRRLLSGCEIGNEGCVALAGALQGHFALQSIDLFGAWGVYHCVVLDAMCFVWYGACDVCVLVFSDWGLLLGCKIASEGWVTLAGALQGLSALQSIDLRCA